MLKQKKPYQKPEIKIHLPSSPAYNRFMKLMEEEALQGQSTRPSENPPVTKKQEAPNV